MNGIKNLRVQFGLTQQLLAAYLDVSRSVLSMAESNKRELSGTALLKLNDLEMALLQLPTHNNTEIIVGANQKYQQVLLIKELKNLEYEITKQQKILEECQKKYEQALLKTSLAAYIEAKPSLTKKDMAWLKVVQGDAAAAIKNYPPTWQIMNEIKLKNMQLHLNDLATYVEKRPESLKNL